MELNKKNIKYYNTSTNLSLNSEMTRTYFPSLTHKELLSIHDLKLKTNYDLRAKVNKNFHRNFHSEIMKTNLKENSKYSTLCKDSTTYTKTETKLPSLIKEDNTKIYKLYINPKTISSLVNNKSVNKKNNINYKTIFNNNSTSKKYNISNISTSGNISPSIKSFKFSLFDKLKSNSNSIDFNTSLLNLETQKSNTNNNSSISNQNYLRNNNTETINNNWIFDLKKKFNKKFVSSLNPLYSSLKKEILSEFYKKTKDINYLKFILMKNKKDIRIEEERRTSNIERLDQIFYSIKTLQNLFNKYFESKYEYLNYLQKKISEETEKSEILKEEKITLTKEIYLIRHKTQRLENRFKNYLNDKFFLLSVKNHSFKLDKFDPDDRADYSKDLKKLEILNFMLKITSNEYNDNDIEKEKLRATRIFKKDDLALLYGESGSITNSPSRKNTSNFHRQNTRHQSSKNVEKNPGVKNSPLLALSKKRILKRNFEPKPIYEDVYYFNKDLQETTQKIQKSLDEYNNIINELNEMKQNLFSTKKMMKDIKDYEQNLKDEIIAYKKKLENLKKLNNALYNYEKYLQNIFIFNLNKGCVCEKINLILNNIEQSKDNALLNFISKEFGDYNTYLITGLDKLKLIERVFQYLSDFKKEQKNLKNEKYFELQREIDNINRQKLCKRKQDLIKIKFETKIQKVIDKNKKIIFIPNRQVNFDMRKHIRKNKTENKEKQDYYDFDEFNFI